MGYYIYAWLDHGNPRLRVVDARTGSICLCWDYHSAKKRMSSDKKEIQRLFRDLLLLTCRQEQSPIELSTLRAALEWDSEIVCQRLDSTDSGH